MYLTFNVHVKLIAIVHFHNICELFLISVTFFTISIGGADKIVFNGYAISARMARVRS